MDQIIWYKYSYNSIPACMFVFEICWGSMFSISSHDKQLNAKSILSSNRLNRIFEIFAVIIRYKKFLIYEHIVIILSLKWIKTTWRRHNRLLTHWNKAEHVLLKLNGLNRGNIETTSEWKLSTYSKLLCNHIQKQIRSETIHSFCQGFADQSEFEDGLNSIPKASFMNS